MRGGKIISDGGTNHTDVLNLESSTRTEIPVYFNLLFLYISLERGRIFAVQDAWLHLHGLGAERPGPT